MHLLRRASLLFAVCLCVIAQTPAPELEVNLAKQFIRSLNAKDVDALLAVTNFPFHFRDQKWEPARDGSGFVLGASVDRIATTSADRISLLTDIVAKVRVLRPDAANALSPSDDFWSSALSGAPTGWSKLRLYAFMRGEADVEHLAVVGVDAQTMRVAAFYVN